VPSARRAPRPRHGAGAGEVASQPAAQLEAVHVREPEVEQDEIDLRRRVPQGIGCVATPRRRVALTGHGPKEPTADALVVLDDQDRRRVR